MIYEAGNKAVCLICGSRRQRNLIQVDVMGWFCPGRRTKGHVCLRCLSGRRIPQNNPQYRYDTIEQKKAVVRFRETQKETYERFKVGSNEWYCMDIEELETMELKK